MLVLSRKKGEQVIITVPPSDQQQVIVVTCVEVRGDKVRNGYQATQDVTIHRKEVFDAIARQDGEAAA